MRKRILILAFAILSVFIISAQETTSEIAGGSNWQTTTPLPVLRLRPCIFLPDQLTKQLPVQMADLTCPMYELEDPTR